MKIVKKKIFFFCVLLIILSVSTVYSQEERVTLTTYYPAPYGDYQEIKLTSDQLTTFTGTQNGALILQGPYVAGRYEAIDFRYNTSITVPTARIAAYHDGSGSKLMFGTSNAYTSGITNTAMTIDQDANVGIGITSPSVGLHVKSNTGNSDIALESVNGYKWTMSTEASTGEWILNRNIPGDLAAIRVNQSGYVGIGVDNPTARLHIYDSNLPIYSSIWFLDSVHGADMVYDGGTDGIFGFKHAGSSSGKTVFVTPSGVHALAIHNTGQWWTGMPGVESAVPLIQRLGNTVNAISFSGWYGSYLEFNVDGAALFGITVWPSSRTRKADIAGIEVDTSNIYKLEPVSFYYKDQKVKDIRHFGLIAEDVEKYFPQLIMRSSKNNEIIGLDYGKLSVLLLNELQKLKKDNDSLKMHIEKMDERLKKLESRKP